jgi:DNA-binding beta-propeller fold protein YncE
MAAVSLLIADSRRMRIGALDDPDDDQPEWLGSPGPGIGEFASPIGVAARPGGGFLVADSGNHRVVGVADIDGSGWEAFGTQGSDPGCFERPSGVAVDGSGRIYITDTGNSRIVRIDNLAGQGWEEYGSRGAPTASDPAAVDFFGRPFALAIDEHERVAVADPGVGRIVRIDSMRGDGWGASTGPPGPAGPAGVAVGDSSSLLVADIQAAALLRLDDPASVASLATGPGVLYAPVAVASGAGGGELFVLDGGAAAGRLVSLDSDFNLLAAHPLEELGFRAPVGMCVT